MGAWTGNGVVVWVVALAGMAVIASIDYGSGIELRVYPLYFAPVSFMAWYRGRAGALLIAALAALSWSASNYLAGMDFTHRALWVANTFVHGLSFVVIAVLIAVLRQSVQRERMLSRTDALTGLLNTRAFYEEGARILAAARRTRRPLTMAYVDLDNFKQVNDLHGHHAGDELLRRVARALAAAVRPSDPLARIGGDEFALLLPDTSAEQAAAALQRLRALLADAHAGAQPGVTCSVGGVTFLTAPRDVEGMVQIADQRMYDAKAAGKDRAHLVTLD